MTITNIQTTQDCEAVIEPLRSSEYKIIKASKEYAFNWNQYKGKEVYKLQLKNSATILGLIHIVPYPQEGYQFLKIEAIEVGKTNVGKSKTYDRIAGCLIAFACKQSFTTGCTGVVMMVAKTNITSLYQSKYGFQPIGSIGTLGERMVSDYQNTNKLIKKYLE